MREMGELAGVPIEPPEQTKLLDTCVSLPGVIGGGVPGGEQRYLPRYVLHINHRQPADTMRFGC
jgi:phosphomevalonate kinase